MGERLDEIRHRVNSYIPLQPADENWLLLKVDRLAAENAALREALRGADDALVAIINHRTPDESHPSGRSNPIDGPLVVAADQAVSRARAALAASRSADAGLDGEG